MKWALPILALCSLALAQRSNSENETARPDIRAGDILDISVWREADLPRRLKSTFLTVNLQVQPDGKISFPLLGSVQAAGLTPKKLTKAITEKLRQYVRNPQVSVQELYVVDEHLPDWWPTG